jgi:uncharacterized damage-inducible protein DinB
MNASELLIEYVRYTYWASTSLLEACSALSNEELRRDLHTAYPSIWATLVHIYQSDCVWLTRYRGGSPTALSAFEPGHDLNDLRTRWQEALQGLVDFAESRSEEQWGETLVYATTKGQVFSQPLWQVVLHQVNHDTLHRGQVLAAFRQIGRVPVSVDLIHYYRRNSK